MKPVKRLSLAALLLFVSACLFYLLFPLDYVCYRSADYLDLVPAYFDLAVDPLHTEDEEDDRQVRAIGISNPLYFRESALTRSAEKILRSALKEEGAEIASVRLVNITDHRSDSGVLYCIATARISYAEDSQNVDYAPEGFELTFYRA